MARTNPQACVIEYANQSLATWAVRPVCIGQRRARDPIKEMKNITGKERMAVWKALKESNQTSIPWESFKRMVHSKGMMGKELRAKAKQALYYHRRSVWLEAMKSQKLCKNVLRDGDCFCAVGLACDIYHKATNKGQWFYKKAGYKRVADWSWQEGNHDCSHSVSPEVLKYYGMDDYYDMEQIIFCNDHGDASCDAVEYLTAINEAMKKGTLRSWHFRKNSTA